MMNLSQFSPHTLKTIYISLNTAHDLADERDEQKAIFTAIKEVNHQHRILTGESVAKHHKIGWASND